MYRQSWLTLRWSHGVVLLALAVLTVSAQAQLNIGENVHMTFDGQIGMGYAGNWQDPGGSGHSLSGSGSAQLSGYYYNPNFLSFTLRPFYNRSQDNGTFTSVLSDSGFDASVGLFSGTHFPGTVAYSKAFINGSQYGVPGLAGLTSNSSNRVFMVSWSELLPNLPNFTVTFSDTGNSSSILGEPGQTSTASRNLNVLSSYKVDGFDLRGFINHQHVGTMLPSFLSPTNARSDSTSTGYGISASHALPLSGVFSAFYNRTNYSSETGSSTRDSATDLAGGGVSFRLTERLSVTGDVRYTRNLIGALQQSVLPAGVPPLLSKDETSHGLSLNTYATYNLGRGFSLAAYASRQSQTFAGIDYTSNRYGGTLTYSYSRPLFGMLYFSFGMVNNGTNSGGNSLGFVGNVTMKRNIAGWEVSSDFSYAQNVQTVIANFTTSNLSYGGMVRRRFGASAYWSTSYHGVETGLTQMPGYSNRSDTFITVLNRGRFGVSGNYSQSHGTALLNGAGALTPTVLAPLVAPDQVMYNGKMYGVGFNVAPMRRMIINANWYRGFSDTLTAATTSANNSDRYYGQMTYKLRKMSFRAGYWRVNQGLSATAIPARTTNSYYFTVTRWFDLF